MRLMIRLDRWLHRVMRGRCWNSWACEKLSWWEVTHQHTRYWAWSGNPGRHIIEVVATGGILEASQVATAPWLIWYPDGSFDDCNASALLDKMGYSVDGPWKRDGDRWWVEVTSDR